MANRARAAGAQIAAMSTGTPVKSENARTGCHSMNVSEGTVQGTRVRLPADVVRPFEVFVNGIAQHEGRDYRIDGRTLLFERELKTEGKLGMWRWLSLWVGVVVPIARTTRSTWRTNGTESPSSRPGFRSSPSAEREGRAGNVKR